MRVFDGVVVSIAMQNTVVVEVTRKTPHPLYKKLMKRNNRFKVDPAGFTVIVGDRVSIGETRKLSKDKYFKIVEVATKGGKKK